MDYQVKTISKSCQATGTELEPGAVCYSVLAEQNGRAVRLDFSEAGWNGPPDGTVGYWRTIVSDRSRPKPGPLDTEALMNYFEQLSDDPNTAQEKLRYVLALFLMQKRRLLPDGQRVDGEIEYSIFSGSKGEGPFEVRDHRLSAEEMEQLQSELNGHLAQE